MRCSGTGSSPSTRASRSKQRLQPLYNAYDIHADVDCIHSTGADGFSFFSSATIVYITLLVALPRQKRRESPTTAGFGAKSTCSICLYPSLKPIRSAGLYNDTIIIMKLHNKFPVFVWCLRTYRPS